MIIKKFSIAGGNSTALVYGCPILDRGKTSKDLLKVVEQVGFVSTNKILPTLTMMGGELCINATIAFASTLSKSGKISTSGLIEPIPYSNFKDLTTIRIPFKFKRDENVILLEGIGFILYEYKEKIELTKSELYKLSKLYKLPAFGGIIYNENRIVPYVFVAGVNSFVRETACGSGSIAFSIFTGINKVIQPTKQIIIVNKRNNFFDISAEVTSLD